MCVVAVGALEAVVGTGEARAACGTCVQVSLLLSKPDDDDDDDDVGDDVEEGEEEERTLSLQPLSL